MVLMIYHTNMEVSGRGGYKVFILHHTLKLWEKVVKTKPRVEVWQCGFMPKKKRLL